MADAPFVERMPPIPKTQQYRMDSVADFADGVYEMQSPKRFLSLTLDFSNLVRGPMVSNAGRLRPSDGRMFGFDEVNSEFLPSAPE
eukprot:4095878-Amphidinium_carterae.2